MDWMLSRAMAASMFVLGVILIALGLTGRQVNPLVIQVWVGIAVLHLASREWNGR